MALHEIVKSIAEEGSGIVIATLGGNFNDCRLVYPESLRSMLADGYFGPDWNPVDAQCEELIGFLEDVGYCPEDVTCRAYSRVPTGKGGDCVCTVEHVYIVKDHRLLLRSCSC